MRAAVRSPDASSPPSAGSAQGPLAWLQRSARARFPAQSPRIKGYMSLLAQEDFYRIQKLPPYVFAVINELKAKARAAQMDVVDLGMGNPDGATPRPVVN